MIFLSIVFGIIAFSVSFVLQALFVIIMERWITRLIPVLSISVISVMYIISALRYYTNERTQVMVEGHRATLGDAMAIGVVLFLLELVVFTAAVIGCIAAIIVSVKILKRERVL